jgi:hypothetical protein
MTKSFFERLFSGPASYSDNRTAAQKEADDTYAKVLAEKTKDDPNRNVTGYANVFDVLTGKTNEQAGFDIKLRDAYNAKQEADRLARNMMADGTQKDDDKPTTASTPIVTETEEEEEDPDTTNTETTEVTTTTPAVQSVLQDAEKGPKSGTIATSAQGIDKDDTTGLRPKRGLRSKQRLGMLASYQPSNTQSLLAGA